jgi:hypothetical protein
MPDAFSVCLAWLGGAALASTRPADHFAPMCVLSAKMKIGTRLYSVLSGVHQYRATRRATRSVVARESPHGPVERAAAIKTASHARRRRCRSPAAIGGVNESRTTTGGPRRRAPSAMPVAFAGPLQLRDMRQGGKAYDYSTAKGGDAVADRGRRHRYRNHRNRAAEEPLRAGLPASGADGRADRKDDRAAAAKGADPGRGAKRKPVDCG